MSIILISAATFAIWSLGVAFSYGFHDRCTPRLSGWSLLLVIAVWPVFFPLYVALQFGAAVGSWEKNR